MEVMTESRDVDCKMIHAHAVVVGSPALEW